LMHKGLAKNI